MVYARCVSDSAFDLTYSTAFVTRPKYRLYKNDYKHSLNTCTYIVHLNELFCCHCCRQGCVSQLNIICYVQFFSVLLLVHVYSVTQEWLYYRSNVLKTEEDVANRIKKTNGVFVQLYPVRRNQNISKGVKIGIFNTDVKSVLLYDCETWKTTNQIKRRLQTFINKWLTL